jgi:O-antigen/teichoic acid export membrane protein
MTETNSPVGGRLVKAAGWTTLGLIATGVLRFGARWISEAAFGLEGLAFMTAAIAIVTIATIPGATGMSTGVTKLIAEKRISGSGTETARTGAKAGMLAAIIAAIGAGIYAGFDPSVKAVGGGGALVVAGLTLAFAAYSLGKAIAFGFERTRRYALEELAGLVLFALGTMGALWLDRVELMAAALILAYLPVARETLLLGPKETEDVARRTLFGYTIVGVVGSFAGIGFTAVTPLAASSLGGVAGAALVGGVLAILEPLNLAPRAVGLVLLPEISRSEAAMDRPTSAKALQTGTGLVAAVALPFCFVLFLERDRVLDLIFSSELVGGATLGWFAMAFLVSVVGAPAVTSLAASRLRLASISMTSSLIGFATAIILWLALGSSWGVPAIAFGYFVGSVIQVGIPIGVAWRRFQVKWAMQWFRIVSAAGVAVLLALFPPSLWTDGLAIASALAFMSPEVGGFLRLLRSNT